ncbi:MAG: tail fiber protein [Bacteriophage sp.]|nr:MAG: tail fiber protein [Bacteriophage sp.]
MGMRIINNVINQLGAPAIYESAFASFPAAGYTGRLLVATDTKSLYRDNGTSYDLIGAAGSGTITGSGTAGKLVKFTGSAVIGDSIATESGSTIYVNGTLSTVIFTETQNAVSTGYLKIYSASAFSMIPYIESVSEVATTGLRLYVDRAANVSAITGYSSGALTMGTQFTATSGYLFDLQNNTVDKFKVDYDGAVTLGSWNAGAVTSSGAISGTNLTATAIAGGTAGNFVVINVGLLVTRTAAQVLSDIGGQPAGTYVTSVTGTTNRITSSGGTTPAIDIAATYVGQSSITTLGTITTGIWNAGAVTSSGDIKTTKAAASNGSMLLSSAAGGSMQPYILATSEATTNGFRVDVSRSTSQSSLTGYSTGAHYLNTDFAATTGFILNVSNNATAVFTVNTSGAGVFTGTVTSIGFLNATGNNLLNSTSGYTAIGSGAISTYQLNVAGATYSENSNSTLNTNKFSFYGSFNMTTTGTETNQYINAATAGAFSFTSTGTFTPNAKAKIGALVGTAFWGSSGTFSGAGQCVFGSNELYGTVTITTLATFRAAAPEQSAGQSAYTGTVTNAVGLYIDDITASTLQSKFTNKYGIYQVGTSDKNFFGGEIILGSGQTVSASVLSTVTNKIKLTVNGTAYYLLASTSNA